MQLSWQDKMLTANLSANHRHVQICGGCYIQQGCSSSPSPGDNYSSFCGDNKQLFFSGSRTIFIHERGNQKTGIFLP